MNRFDKQPLFFLTTSFPKNSGDFAGCFVATMATYFTQVHTPIEIIYPIPKGQTPKHAAFPRIHLNPYQTQAQLLNHQGGPDWIEAHPIQKWQQIPMIAIDLQLKLLSILKHQRSSKWVVHWLVPNALLLAFLKQAGFELSMVVYVHGGDLAVLEGLPFADMWAYLIYRESQRLIFVSQALYSRFLKLLLDNQSKQYFELDFKKLSVLPMGIDSPVPDQAFLTLLSTHSRGNPRFRLCTVGRIVKIKGLFLLADALGILKGKGLSFCWYIAGIGPERRALSNALREKQLKEGEDFIFLGQISPTQREALFVHCHLFVLPSLRIGQRTEGMPLALREAMNAGINVLCSDQGGGMELFDDVERAHFIFTVPHLSTLVEKLTENISQPKLQHDRCQMIRHKSKHDHWESLWHKHWALCQILYEA